MGGLPAALARSSDTEADRQGVPRDFARSIFHAEHGLLADGRAAVSPAGAIGAGQLMPGTADQVARELGETVNPYNLQQNVRGSVRYMSDLLKMFHDNRAAAAAAYNAGPAGRGVQHFAETGDPSQLPAETQAYIQPFLGSGAQPDGKVTVHVTHDLPAGFGVTVQADPSQIDVTGPVRSGPRTMAAMPTSGQPRNIAQDGF